MDFYAPYLMPGGYWIYGAAALNRRIKDAGDFNTLARNLVMMGYKQAVRENRKKGKS